MSSSRRTKGAARAAVLFGALAVLAIPAGIAASRLVAGITLLRSLYVAVAAAFVLGLISWAASRKARYAVSRSVYPSSAGPVRLGRFLAWAGLYVSLTGTLAIAFYAVLQSQR